MESAACQSPSYSASQKKFEKTWDHSKKIKKIALKLKGKYVEGIQFLDEKDNEIVKWDGYHTGTWQPAKEVDDGFEIIGLYGNVPWKHDDPQFGFLIWNPKPSVSN